MKPEEKLASRLLERHGLAPPYDLKELVLLYADLDYLEFPVEADGVSLDLKKVEKPRIYINSKRHPVRQRFTLAHELGHVIIPWHIGNIISHATFSVDENDADTFTDSNSRESYQYRKIESEANRFAAELLLPTEWLQVFCKEIDASNFKENLENIINESQSSRDTALIKLFYTLPPGYICVEVDCMNIVIKSFMSLNTQVYKPSLGTDCSSDPYLIYKDKISFSLGDRHYILWVFDNTIEIHEESLNLSWRQTLEVILDETGLHHKKPSINSILPSLFQSLKCRPEAEICSSIIHRYSTRDDLKDFFSHPLFNQYVLKRVKELRVKYPRESG